MVNFSGKLKIFKHDENNFSLAVLPDSDDQISLLKCIEANVISLLQGKKFKRKVFEHELKLVKIDKSDKMKLFAKMYSDSKGKILARFSKKKEVPSFLKN